MPETPHPNVFRFGVFVVDPSQRTLHKRGVRLKLYGQPLEILLLLIERRGEVVRREDLQRRLWSGDTFADFENGLNAAIKKLRQTLGDSAEQPRYIETVPRIGYRFIGVLQADAAAQNAAEAPKAALPRAAVNGRHAWSFRWRSTVIAAALGLAALGGYEWQDHRAAATSIRSIAVLPFQNLSGDSAQDYIADGMTDELVTDLAQIQSLRVISRTSTLHYKNTSETIPRIAQELHVDAIVEGTVARSAQEVRVTAQLVEARDDRHLWAESYNRDLGDILSL